MAQQNMVNGPTNDGNHLKNEINNQESHQNKLSSEQTVNSPPPQQSGPFITRPPLNRVDSRQNFQYRPPFPTTNQPSGPQSIGPQSLGGNQPNTLVNSGPQSIGPSILGGQQVRPQQGVRQPVISPQFVQRGPPLGPGGTQNPRPTQSASSALGGPFPQNQQQQRPAFRPQTPYPRPPLLGQRPNIFQQSSVPAFNRPRPALDETPNRSLTLDSSELENQKNAEANRNYSPDQRPPSAASLGRSYSVTTSNPSLDQKKISESQESLHLSRQSSLENVFKKEENVPSRPESRTASRMDKIIENEDKLQLNKNIPDNKGSEVTNGEVVTSRSPSKDSPDHQNYNAYLNSPKKYEAINSPKFEDPDNKKKELDLKLASKSTKGDNDSGVDESTQGNDQSCNGESRSPRKPSKSRTSSTTPTTGRSVSRGSKTPSSLQSPDSAATTPGSAEKKKVPMNKIQVGSAPSPNLKVVKSKIGSLDNAHYKPGGGKVKIENKKLDFKNAGSKIEAKNEKYAPKVGEKKELNSARSVKSSTSPRKVITKKLEWNAKSKIGSLENASYKPKGGDKKIESVKLDFKDKAKSKVGSKDNIKYQPGGGDIKKQDSVAEELDCSNTSIENKKIELHATSKVGSLDNVKHKPAGGDKKIFDDKDYLKNKSGKSSMEHSLSGSQTHKNDQIIEKYTMVDPKKINSPVDSTRRILDTLDEEEVFNFSGRFIRSGSTRSSKHRQSSQESPRPQWRF